ncbi:MAG: MFS transporter [Anaerolineaceae bacterium]|nr:MFS transporter [Anaerolineaceae bacterium]
MRSNIIKVVIINFAQRFHLYIHAYALLLQGRGLDLLQISTIESVVIGTIFLMEVPTGVIADRIGRKWSIAASTFLMMCAETLFIFAQDYALYLFIGVLTGTGFAFASGAVESMVYDSLPPDGRENAMKRAMGLVGSTGQIAFFIAPIIGAIIIGDATPERFTAAIVLTALSLFLGLLVSFTLKEPPTDWEAEKPNALGILRNGIAELRGSPQLQRIVMLLVFTMPFTGTLIGVLAAPYLTQNGVSPFMVGVALSVGSLMAAFTQRYAFKVEEWLGQRVAITVLVLLPGILYGILAMIAGPIWAWLLVVLLYGTNDMKAPLFSAYQNALIASQSRATVLSLINMIVSLFIAIVAPIYAAIATRSLPLAFLVMGSVILVAGITLRVDRLMPKQVAENSMD